MIEFYKYHGTGNDFILINNLEENIKLNEEEIKILCDRHISIGADGIILLEKSEKANCFMNYYNSDGTKAEMCGNGIRCTALFFTEQTNSKLDELSIDTRAGIKKIKINKDNTFSVNMGKPIFESKDFPKEKIFLENFELNFVSMGNPHSVIETKNLDNIDIKKIGPIIENDKHFPNKINVEFVEKIRDDYFKVKVWERGCGETLACGTGACAIYATLTKKIIKHDLTEMTLKFPGGNLYLSENNNGEIILRGTATFTFKGEINL